MSSRTSAWRIRYSPSTVLIPAWCSWRLALLLWVQAHDTINGVGKALINIWHQSRGAQQQGADGKKGAQSGDKAAVHVEALGADGDDDVAKLNEVL